MSLLDHILFTITIYSEIEKAQPKRIKELSLDLRKFEEFKDFSENLLHLLVSLSLK